MASWIDDLLNIGSSDAINYIKNNIKSLFDCSDEGEMMEYVGCKIERSDENKQLKMTQPVIMQSFKKSLIYRTVIQLLHYLLDISPKEVRNRS